MNIVISDPKAGRAYSKKTEEATFVGRGIGETVSLDAIGLNGYKAVITGGSDKDGFPMKQSLEGQGRKKLLMEKGVGLKQKRKGEKRRKRVRGNTVAPDIHQLNLKITEYGPVKLSETLKKAAGEEKKEEKAKAGERKEEKEKKEVEEKEAKAEEGKEEAEKKGEHPKEEKAGAKEKKERAEKREEPTEKGKKDEGREEKEKTKEEKKEEKPEKKID